MSARLLTGPGALLASRADAWSATDPSTLHGFGGVHGGLVLARLAHAASAHVPDRTLRAVHGQFHRPVADTAFDAEVQTAHVGRRLTSVDVVAATAASRRPAVRATVILGSDGTDSHDVHRSPAPAAFAPGMPDAGRPLDHDTFSVPVEFVPFTQHLEIRPVGDERPFAGGNEPVLTAWIRLVEDDAPPDPLRLVMLSDALAPSLAAVLTDLAEIPTVELSVHLSQTRSGGSPWLLLRARSHATVGGFVHEQIDAWDPNGVHLARATQLRLVVS